jgi:hypothetical protein
MVKEKFVLFLVALSALLLSASAAFFSVYGLSKVFAGAGVSVIIMASVLEGSKLIAAYSLHQNKDILPTSLKTYLSIAIVVLMLITSAGIYGFLSNAYQITSNKNNIAESKINIVRAKSNNLTTRLKSLEDEKESIIKDITELRNGLSNGTMVSYIDRKSGEKVTSSSSETRKSLESQLNDATKRRDNVSDKIEEISSQVDGFEISILNMETNNDAAAELGPIIYLSKVTNLPMDNLMNYFILMIIFVFDPFAITLVITVSYLVNNLSKSTKKDDFARNNSDILDILKDEETDITQAYEEVTSNNKIKKNAKKSTKKSTNKNTEEASIKKKI